MQTKKFSKNKEDFTCSHCGAVVIGDGYTNHCPKCLWSKHVDIFPGDRLSDCKGEMRPQRITGTTGEGYNVEHICEKCGHIKANKLAREDDMDVVFAIISRYADMRM